MRVVEEELSLGPVRVEIGRGSISALREVKGKKASIYPRSLSKIAEKFKGEFDLVYAVEDGEKGKDVQNVLDLAENLLQAGFTRWDTVVSLGGGTVSDLAGFTASIYMRGINLVNVPTTLLGMVDASIGGKNGINFGGFKNLLGTFYHPSLIVEDLDFLDSLPQVEITRGMAEVIKYAVTLDKGLYDYLAEKDGAVKSREEEVMEEVVERSVLDKLQVVKADERETKGIRIVLNFGHTMGHAIEASTGFEVSHGEAISVGMVCESKIAEELGFAEEGVVEDVVWILRLYGLPITVEELKVKPDVGRAKEALSKDKKLGPEGILMPFPSRLGAWRRVEVPVSVMEGFVEQCLR